MRYFITDIEQGKGDYRSKILYATLRDMDDGLVISATLDYILRESSGRRYDVINFPEALARYIDFQQQFLK